MLSLGNRLVSHALLDLTLSMTLKRCLRSGLRSMLDGTVEIITGKERRRRWSVGREAAHRRRGGGAGCPRDARWRRGMRFIRACCSTGGVRCAKVGLGPTGVCRSSFRST